MNSLIGFHDKLWKSIKSQICGNYRPHNFTFERDQWILPIYEQRWL